MFCLMPEPGGIRTGQTLFAPLMPPYPPSIYIFRKNDILPSRDKNCHGGDKKCPSSAPADYRTALFRVVLVQVSSRLTFPGKPL
jgi:hypothetical protein